MKKNTGVACAVFAGLLALLAGCPTDMLTETGQSYGESYIDEAVVINEKAKYETAVVFEFDEGDAGTDVTGRLMQLNPGKSANPEVRVSISGAGGNYFSLYNGKLSFTGQMPPSEEAYKAARAELELAIKDAEDGALKALLRSRLNEMGGVPNTEVITLSFRKGGTVATLDVLAVIEKKGGEKPERNVADVAASFVIYGYDVINSGYINRNDVKRDAPILDPKKVDAGRLLTHTPGGSTIFWIFNSEKSVSELLKKINEDSSVDYRGALFSGKVDSEFSTEKDSQKTSRYAKVRGFSLTRKYFLTSATAKSLKNYLDSGFVAAVNGESAAYILRTYGTHLITKCFLGGEAEANYSYFGAKLADERAMEEALTTVYGEGGGSEYTTLRAELNGNSVFTSSFRGGNNASFTTADEFLNGYRAWVASIQENPDLCEIPGFDDSLLPIWELAAQVNPSKAVAIQAAFDSMVAERMIKLDGFTSQSGRNYVTALNVFMLSGLDNAPTVPDGYTNLVKDDIYNPDKGGAMDTYIYTFIRNDLKANLTTDLFDKSWTFIKKSYRLEKQQPYIAYSRTANDHRQAIAELRVAPDKKSLGMGWEVIDVNLHEPGQSPLYLHYRRVNKNDTEAIDFIGSFVADQSPGSEQILSGYEWVNGGYVDDKGKLVNTGRANLSIPVHWSVYMGLMAHKSPFAW